MSSVRGQNGGTRCSFEQLHEEGREEWGRQNARMSRVRRAAVPSSEADDARGLNLASVEGQYLKSVNFSLLPRFGKFIAFRGCLRVCQRVHVIMLLMNFGAPGARPLAKGLEASRVVELISIAACPL